MNRRFGWTLIVVAGGVFAACGSGVSRAPEAGYDAGAPDAQGDLVSGDTGIDTTGPDAVEPPPCTDPVCYAPLDPMDYPEAQTPPRHALHCNERGLANGCPEGMVCGDVVEVSGLWIPACVPVDPAFDRLDLDHESAILASADDEQGVPVQVVLASNGEAFPVREPTLFERQPYSSYVTFTHRDSGQQWTEAIPLDPNAGFGLNLRPGIHDVLLSLADADFPSLALATLEQRGILTVDGPGTAVLDQAADTLEIQLRYLGSTLTGAESQAMSVTLLSESGLRFVHQYTSGERGITSLRVPSGTYQLEIASNGLLPSLFPALPMTLDLALEVPETREVQVDLDPLMVEGSLDVNGAPAGAEGQAVSLVFSNGERFQTVTIPPGGDGTFRALVWPGERYDIYFSSPNGAEALLASDWSPHTEEPLALSVDTELVIFDIDMTAFGQGPEEEFYVNLVTRHTSIPFTNQRWHQGIATTTGFGRWEIELVLGEQVDIAIYPNGDFFQGSWMIAEGHVIDRENDLRVDLVDVSIWYEFSLQDGTPANVSQARLFLDGPGGAGFSSLWVHLIEERSTPVTLFGGIQQAYLWPLSGEQGIPNQRYPLGELTIEDGDTLVFEAVAYQMTGEVTIDGQAINRLGQYQTGYVSFLSSGQGQNYWFNSGQSTYEITLAQGVHQVFLRCQDAGCEETTIGTQVVRMYDAINLRP